MTATEKEAAGRRRRPLCVDWRTVFLMPHLHRSQTRWSSLDVSPVISGISRLPRCVRSLYFYPIPTTTTKAFSRKTYCNTATRQYSTRHKLTLLIPRMSFFCRPVFEDLRTPRRRSKIAWRRRPATAKNRVNTAPIANEHLALGQARWCKTLTQCDDSQSCNNRKRRAERRNCVSEQTSSRRADLFRL
jgi:hypothetical protein